MKMKKRIIIVCVFILLGLTFSCEDNTLEELDKHEIMEVESAGDGEDEVIHKPEKCECND